MPVMQRRHYEKVAEAVRTTRERANADSLPTFINALADVLQADNPNFRREQFLVACGFPAVDGTATWQRPPRRRRTRIRRDGDRIVAWL